MFDESVCLSVDCDCAKRRKKRLTVEFSESLFKEEKKMC